MNIDEILTINNFQVEGTNYRETVVERSTSIVMLPFFKDNICLYL